MSHLHGAGISEGTRRIWAVGFACLAVLTSFAGFAALVGFDSAPGRVGLPPLDWPHGSAIRHNAGRAHMVMFVHPLCSCTEASLTGLEKLAASRRPFPADITFAVFRPNPETPWDWSALEKRTRLLPASTVLWDDGGTEARRFRAGTSGTVVLYSDQGKLLFFGGITGSRGHEGDNYGLSRVDELLSGRLRTTTPLGSRVFGCALETQDGGSIDR